MLDLNEPLTKFIFAISGQNDAILSICKRMTLVDTEHKRKLLLQAETHLTEMRSITIKGWGNSSEKIDAIDRLQECLISFVAIPSDNNFIHEWVGKHCTVCGGAIEDLAGYADMVYCRRCITHFDAGRKAIDQVFGLWWI
ncbi:hypothetical protein Syn7502_00008 [Synechococcus sp. PCC 7502]|uniref:hypothetical protein n=1 Tax=Synechococcus sp. PCC 7502 TaxID=1173263 RepID=UPI00029FDF53|nr:hypothetical protein [Synechococcus sp. PCC 7502]AFY72183.1 hypothetical protein Syn7502_00008 [Synechococcus sp. PCC 7502]